MSKRWDLGDRTKRKRKKSIVGALVHHHWGDDTLSTITGEDDPYAPECHSLTSLDTLHPITREELIGAYNLPTFFIQIKSDLIVILHLVWERLDVLLFRQNVL